LSSRQRCDATEVLGLIEQRKYGLLHVPRQTGETTCLLLLAGTLLGEVPEGNRK